MLNSIHVSLACLRRFPWNPLGVTFFYSMLTLLLIFVLTVFNLIVCLPDSNPRAKASKTGLASSHARSGIDFVYNTVSRCTIRFLLVSDIRLELDLWHVGYSSFCVSFS